ncbi:glutaredoxin domain-containing protein [Bailinhaonella thermotolerans]|uniref:NrdH-redoxin n=1 Tax=Bailinhaonella thermotolerans TaxID=1070861 RepID=A0A3A4AZ55_9ACTN|nr:glutaredoxin domain-containing protein [Bailinhaonella thermotolerans]RJL34403.1 NrdH-redoxin [Bailinhaonella thermotolerans]
MTGTLLLLVVVLLVVLGNLPRPGRATTHAAADRTGTVLYWRPGCVYCMRLRTRLLFSRLAYAEVNIWRDPEAAAFVRSVADGNETVPTVTVDGRAMVNPSLRRLREAVAARDAA